jgi:hypothetical protein
VALCDDIAVLVRVDAELAERVHRGRGDSGAVDFSAAARFRGVEACGRIAPTHQCVSDVLAWSEARPVSAGGGEVWIQSLAAQGRKYLREESRHVHLRIAQAFRDLGLGQVLEESKHENGSLAIG